MVYKLFNLYTGETKGTLFFALLAFLWSTAATCGVTLSDGLLLTHLGSSYYPKAYFVAAIVLFFVASLSLRHLSGHSVKRLLLLLVLIGIVGYSAFALVMGSGVGAGSSLFWISLKVFATVFEVVMITYCWTFIDQFYDLQDGKRLFALFSSATFLGSIASGAFIHQALAVIGVEGILFFVAGVLFVTFLWVIKINKTFSVLEDDTIGDDVVQEVGGILGILRLTLASPFSLVLMATTLLTQLLVIVTEYNYMHHFELAFGQEGDYVLLLFLAKCTAWLAFFNFVFNLFIYSRLAKRFGIYNIFFATPLFFLSFFFTGIFSSSLFLAITGLFIVEAGAYSFDDNNFNLLLSGVSSRLKAKVRVLVESFSEPMGMLLGSLLLMIVNGYSMVLGLALAFSALVVYLSLRVLYPKAIYRNLANNVIKNNGGELLEKWPESLHAEAREFFERSFLDGDGAVCTDVDALKQLLAEAASLCRVERRKWELAVAFMGKKVAPILVDLLNDSSLSEQSRLMAARSLQMIRPSKLCKQLLAVIRKEIDQAHFYFFHSHVIKESSCSITDVNRLKEVLLAAYHTSLNLVIHLLNLPGSVENTEVLTHSLRSPNQKIHSQAVETVGKMCDPKIFQQLEPLLDDRPLEHKLCLYRKSRREEFSLPELLDYIGVRPANLQELQVEGSELVTLTDLQA
ncbi:hypothetical protein JYU14_02955 [Simkania negevensis]|uniref:ADP,ATP carrier protein n=1 Tax=Simkania negevensis TaxID=83561 RepID=A0ABS3ARR9_9BACT|nr:hypothetical protein [Simkania negevensis]